MLVTAEELEKFSGVTRDDDTTSASLVNIYINSATDVINKYVGFDVISRYTDEEAETVSVPEIFKLVCLEIASLMQQEESGNIGVNNKNFPDAGSRTFLNVVNYDKYLQRLSAYRETTDL